MKLAETVTFGGSALDRAAELRGDEAALAEARLDAAARTIVHWRGKPLMCGERQGELARLPLDHPIMREATAPPLLLGRENGAVIFAHDISPWQPEGQDTDSVGAFRDASSQHYPGTPGDHLFYDLKQKMWWISPRDAELSATARAVMGWHRSHRFCSACGAESEMAQSGWQRICPACGASHFPRTDPVVIMLITHGNSVLMGRSPGWPEGMYSLLAGFVEPGETIEAAVRREVFEEAGIDVGQVDYLSSQPWPFPSSLMFGCHGEALSDRIEIDPTEIEDARWISREEMMQVFAGDHPVLGAPRKGAIAEFILRMWLADRLD